MSFNLKRAYDTGETAVSGDTLQQIGGQNMNAPVEGAFWNIAFNQAWKEPKVVNLESIISYVVRGKINEQDLLSAAANEINIIAQRAKEISTRLQTDDPSVILQYMREEELQGIAYDASASDQEGVREHERIHRSGKTQTPQGAATELSRMIGGDLPGREKQQIAQGWVDQWVRNLKQMGYTEQEIPGELAAYQPQMEREFSKVKKPGEQSGI